MIVISIARQMLYHHRNSGVCQTYPVSTAALGSGNRQGSWQTPLGKHRIAEKIGASLPLLTAFRGRQACGIYNPAINDAQQDWILTRILWLAGCETGRNRRGQVDTQARYIYIHGTHAEDNIGSPASHGCIRMRNEDMLQLFEHARVNERVNIRA